MRIRVARLRHDHPPTRRSPIYALGTSGLSVKSSSRAADWHDLHLVQHARPPSLRAFDQIPMRSSDLLRQAKLLAPRIANSRVAFVGDSDGLSLLLGLLGARSDVRPAALHLLDFDERLLKAALDVADQRGFGDLLHIWRYNVFDPVPAALEGCCDFFVTNPPYGMRNEGASARLFIARGTELITPSSGQGGIILPDDPARPWTEQAMSKTLKFLEHHGWVPQDRQRAFHRYHLDDDPELASDFVLVARALGAAAPSPYTGRRVDVTEIPHFYGHGTPAPYPRYIRVDGTFDNDWTNDERQMYEWQPAACGKVA